MTSKCAVSILIFHMLDVFPHSCLCFKHGVIIFFLSLSSFYPVCRTCILSLLWIFGIFSTHTHTLAASFTVVSVAGCQIKWHLVSPGLITAVIVLWLTKLLLLVCLYACTGVYKSVLVWKTCSYMCMFWIINLFLSVEVRKFLCFLCECVYSFMCLCVASVK